VAALIGGRFRPELGGNDMTITNEDSIIYKIDLINRASDSADLVVNLNVKTIYPYYPVDCRLLVNNEVSIGTVSHWRDDIADAIECGMERDLFQLMLSAARQRLDALQDAAWIEKYDEVTVC
jgi:hypothetical protein